MMKIKRILVGILVMALFIGIVFAPVNVQAKEEAAKVDAESSYIDYLIKQSTEGYAAVFEGTVVSYGDVSIYDSGKYLTSQRINIILRENIFCSAAYDMTAIASKYQTVLAFGDTNGYYRPVIGYTSDGTAEIIYDIDGYDSLGYDKEGYDAYYGRDYEGYNRDGYDCEGYDRDGYDWDGYDRNGYDRNGYNRNGYNKDGYNKDGYNKDGYNKDGYNQNKYENPDNNENEFVVDKIVASQDSNGKLSLSVLNVNGDKIDSDNYKVSTKAISARKGCGTYKITVKLNEKCGGKTITKTVKVIPSLCVKVFLHESGYSRESKYYTGKDDCSVIIADSKDSLKMCDGVQYVIGRDKGFKKIYIKNTIKLTKYNDLEYKEDKEFKVKDGSTCYIKYRVYTVVDGKKIYSEWFSYNSKVIL